MIYLLVTIWYLIGYFEFLFCLWFGGYDIDTQCIALAFLAGFIGPIAILPVLVILPPKTIVKGRK